MITRWTALAIATAFLIAPLTGRAQSIRYPISVTSCGVRGNRNTDDTAALNKCIADLPDYGVLQIPAGAKIKITGTVKIYGKYGIRIEGLSSVFGGPSLGTDTPSIYWYGPDGGKMVDIDNTENFLIQGITLFSAPEYSDLPGGADYGFNIDQALQLGVTTTNGIFERVSVNGIHRNPNFRAIAFALNSGSNVEHMTVRDSNISCSYWGKVGQGIVIGPSYNAKKHLYENNSIVSCATGIWVASGSADIVHNQFNQNAVHIFANPVDPMTIRDNDSENASQFFKGQFGYGGSLINNRIAAVSPPAGTGAVQFIGGLTAVLQDNFFELGNYVPVSGQGGPYGGPALTSRGNSYPNFDLTIAGFKTFGYGVNSQMDLMGSNGGLSMIASKGGFAPTPPTPGMGFFNYDWTTQKWQVSENAGVYRNLTPDFQVSEPACSYAGRVWLDTSNPSQTTERHCLAVGGKMTWVSWRDIQSSDPGCTYLGRVWLDTSNAAQTVERHCLMAAGTLTWIVK